MGILSDGRFMGTIVIHSHKDIKMEEQHTLNDFFRSRATYDLLKRLPTISALPLKKLEDKFSIDASGFGSYGYERWQRVRSLKNKRGWRNYLKGHIMIGTRTNIICSCSITPGNFSDCKQAPGLIDEVGHNFDMKEVSADKAYLSKRIFQVIESFNAVPLIPFKQNNKKVQKDAPEIWNKMYKYFSENQEDFLKRYHVRSNVETTFAMVKMRLGEFLLSKTFTSQRNELMLKFIVHNICCLIQEIFENKVHIDFKNCLNSFVEREVEDPYPKTALREELY